MSAAFHIHVYWSTDTQRAQALALREAAAARYPQAVLGRLHEAPFAFHPSPMYQIALDGVELGALLVWLQRHRGSLSLLVHPLTGDPIQEHLEEAIWLGAPLALDEQRLRTASSAHTPAPAAPPSAGPTILRIDASARRTGSIGRTLADELLAGLQSQSPDTTVVTRDLLNGLPLLDEEVLGAWGSTPDTQTPAQAALLETSERLIRELEDADAVVLAVPIYNFHVPAAFKAWIDLVARARRTFRYTPQGPVGLLADRPVYVVITSGGTRLGSRADFVSGWLRQVLGFIGLKDVHFIEADGLMSGAEERLQAARDQIAAYTARPAA